jgi:hypothetical protein
MTVENNKAVVTHFFQEALDKGNVGLVDGMFTKDCVFHRGDLTEPARGIPGIRSIVEKRVQLYPGLPNGNSSDDRGRRLGRHPRDPQRHSPGPIPHTIGTFDITGRPIEWISQVLFRFEDRKISEMWVARDELGILRYLGIVLEARK